MNGVTCLYYEEVSASENIYMLTDGATTGGSASHSMQSTWFTIYWTEFGGVAENGWGSILDSDSATGYTEDYVNGKIVEYWNSHYSEQGQIFNSWLNCRLN